MMKIKTAGFARIPGAEVGEKMAILESGGVNAKAEPGSQKHGVFQSIIVHQS
jgi:hypothetical protein